MKKYLIIFVMVLLVVALFGSEKAFAAPLCNNSGDACTLSSGQAGTCGGSRGSGMLCYSNANPSVTEAATASNMSASGNVVNFTNPLAFTTVEGFLGSILTAIQRIVVTLALVFIVIGAVLIITSAGNPEMSERGKKAITMAIVGLAIGIAAPSILKELAGILGWGSVSGNCNPGDVNCASVDRALTLSQIAVRTLNFLLGISGILSLIMLVIGGITYLTSAGDEGRIESGKKIFTYSLIGIIIVMSSMVLVRQIAAFFAIS